MPRFFQLDKHFIWKSVLTGKEEVKLHSISISPPGSVNVAQIAQLTLDILYDTVIY